MTFSQQIIYEVVKKYIEEYGTSPSIREICDLSGLNSKSTVHKHLKNLKDKGYIGYEPKKKRSIRINDNN